MFMGRAMESCPELHRLSQIGLQSSELHTFSYQVQHPEDSVTLIPDALFVAKIECASYPESHLWDVHLEALAPFVGPDLKVDANNCLVLTIKIRKGQKHLFVAYKPGHTEEMKPVTVSSWIV